MAGIENVPRQVIENTLLAALDDNDKVAIVVNKDDLNMIICAMESVTGKWCKQHKEMVTDLHKLMGAAFGD